MFVARRPFTSFGCVRAVSVIEYLETKRHKWFQSCVCGLTDIFNYLQNIFYFIIGKTELLMQTL
jgi:hypothetical protein